MGGGVSVLQCQRALGLGRVHVLGSGNDLTLAELGVPNAVGKVKQEADRRVDEEEVARLGFRHQRHQQEYAHDGAKDRHDREEWCPERALHLRTRVAQIDHGDGHNRKGRERADIGDV